jgi:glycosyltransferase 2 family protein
VAVRLGGSAVVLALLFYFVPFGEAWHALRRLPPSTWLWVLGAYLCLHLIGVSKYKLMLNGADAGLNFVQAARCYFAGLFSTLFLPSVVGGDVVKAAMALRLSRSRAGALLGTFLDRMLDATALMALAALGAALAPTLGSADRRGFLLILEILAAIAVVGAIAMALMPWRKFSYRIRRRLVRLRRAWQAISRRPRRVVAALGLAFVVQLGFLTLTTVIGAACGLHLPYRSWLFAWPLAKISAFAPVGQAGIGVREAALAAFLAPFGAVAGAVVGVGLAWDTIIIAGGLIAGLITLVAGRFAGASNQTIDSGAAQRYGVRPS